MIRRTGSARMVSVPWKIPKHSNSITRVRVSISIKYRMINSNCVSQHLNQSGLELLYHHFYETFGGKELILIKVSVF